MFEFDSSNLKMRYFYKKTALQWLIYVVTYPNSSSRLTSLLYRSFITGIVLYDDLKTSQVSPKGSLKIEMLFMADCLTMPMSNSFASETYLCFQLNLLMYLYKYVKLKLLMFLCNVFLKLKLTFFAIAVIVINCWSVYKGAATNVHWTLVVTALDN